MSPQWVTLLEASDADLRWPTIEALEKIGPSARAALPALRELASTAANDEAAAARRAIAKVPALPGQTLTH